MARRGCRALQNCGVVLSEDTCPRVSALHKLTPSCPEGVLIALTKSFHKTPPKPWKPRALGRFHGRGIRRAWPAPQQGTDEGAGARGPATTCRRSAGQNQEPTHDGTHTRGRCHRRHREEGTGDPRSCTAAARGPQPAATLNENSQGRQVRK